MALLIIIGVFTLAFLFWVLIIFAKGMFERWLEKDKRYYKSPFDIKY